MHYHKLDGFVEWSPPSVKLDQIYVWSVIGIVALTWIIVFSSTQDVGVGAVSFCSKTRIFAFIKYWFGTQY